MVQFKKMKRLYNALYQFQAYLMGIALFLVLLSVSVRVKGSSIDLLWKDYPFMAIVILLTGLFFIILYIQIDKYKLTKLRNRIKKQSIADSNDFANLLLQLTKRQREVYDQIILGKSNKEIRKEFFIEASTLKTHINQIYKKLNINNRRELRIFHDKHMKN